MARIFRALLIAAVNAIKEFLAFATDNGESQVGDSVKLNDGMATSNYDWSAYPSNTEIIGTYTQTGTVEQVKEVSGNTVYVTQEPQQDNKDVSIKAGQIYYAYTNANDDTLYTTDNPISKGIFNLQNATKVGELSKNGSIYSGFAEGKYIKLGALNPTTSLELVIKCNPNSSGGDLWRTQPDGKGILLRNSTAYISTSGNGWDITSFSTGLTTMTGSSNTYIKVSWNNTDNKITFFECSDGENWIPRNYVNSNLPPYLSGGNQTIGGCDDYSESWNGLVDMSETYAIVDGVRVNFGYFGNSSTLYENTETTEFTPVALDPQPSFTIKEPGLYNASVVSFGTLTNNNGVYSGFVDNEFISVTDTLSYSTSFKMIFKVNTGADNFGVITATDGSERSLFINSQQKLELRYNGSTIGTNTLSANTEYWVALESNGTSVTWYTDDGTHGSLNKSQVPALTDTSFWRQEGTKAITSAFNNANLYIGCDPVNNRGYYFRGSIDMVNTYLEVDGITTTFYNSKTGITIENDLYERNSSADEIKSISGVSIDTVDNTTIQSVSIDTTDGYIDIPYYAYTNENDNTDTLYATDNPVSKGIFNLQNATNNGCTDLGNGIYQCSPGNNITTSIGTDIQTASKWEICCKYNNQSASGYPTIFAPADSSYTQNPFLQLVSNKMYLFLRDVNGNDIIQGDTGYTLPSGFHLIQVGWTGTKYYMNVDGDEKWYYNSSIATKSNQDIIFLNLMSYNYWGYAMDMSQTSITIDNTTTNFGYFSNPSVLYENTGTTEFTPVALDPQPEFSIGTKYSGGLNGNVVGTLQDNNGVYSGFAYGTNYVNAGQNLKSTNNAVYEFKTKIGNSFSTIASCDKLFYIGISNQYVSTYNYGTSTSEGRTYLGNDWGFERWFKIEINGTTKTFSMRKDTDANYTVLWTGEDTGMDATYNSDLYLGSGPNLNAIEDGWLDLASSSATLNNVKTPFYTEKLSYSIIQIENDTYARNVNKDNFTRETVPATIETSANITTSNNDNVITDGSYHLFNLTVPTSMTPIIESSGISYQPANMPLLLKSNTSVGFLLKYGNNAYYRNSWVMNKSYDLHYQQINFSYPSGATVTCKVNNVTTDLTPYVYAGDIVSWTCDNAGTITTGTYTAKYSNLDGNIQTITIS